MSTSVYSVCKWTCLQFKVKFTVLEQMWCKSDLVCSQCVQMGLFTVYHKVYRIEQMWWASDLVCLQCVQMGLFTVYHKVYKTGANVYIWFSMFTMYANGSVYSLLNGSTDNVMFISLYTVHTNGSVFSLP